MKKIYLFIILLLINISAFSQVTLPYAYDFEGDSLSSGWNKYPEPDGGSCYNTLFFGLQDGYFVFLSQYRIFGGCGDDYRQYLVTPKLINNTSDSVQIRFKCKALQPINSASYAPEAFVIGYFTGNQYASVDDFIWSEDTVYTTNYTEWQTLRQVH